MADESGNTFLTRIDSSSSFLSGTELLNSPPSSFSQKSVKSTRRSCPMATAVCVYHVTVCLSISLCLSVSLSVYMSAIRLSGDRCVCVCVCVCVSLSLSDLQYFGDSICLFIRESIPISHYSEQTSNFELSVCLTVCLSANPYLSLSSSLSLSLSLSLYHDV